MRLAGGCVQAKKLRRISVCLTLEQHAQAERESVHSGFTVSQLVRQALLRYLEQLPVGRVHDAVPPIGRKYVTP